MYMLLGCDLGAEKLQMGEIFILNGSWHSSGSRPPKHSHLHEMFKINVFV